MTVEKANKIYDILVTIGGAYEVHRDGFIYLHTKSEKVLNEWRFSLKRSYVGRYINSKNIVCCYIDDETPELIKLIKKINKALEKI